MGARLIEGLPAVDAKSALTIKITKTDIGRANRKEPDQCVIARCCRKMLHVKEARVHLSRVYLRTDDSGWTRYMTSPALRDEIIAFDRGGEFEAGEYQLAPISKSSQTGKRHGSDKPSNPKKKQKPRKAPHFVANVRDRPE